MKEKQFIISMLVSNHFGVLTRVSGLFSRRGFNIDSLSVGETENPQFSRMTIVTTGDEYIKEQIVKQISKLYDVKSIELMEIGNSVIRELALVKIVAEKNKRGEILEAVNVFRGKVVDFTTDSLSVEITGNQSKLNAFFEYIRPYGIIELSRTGATALGRGKDSLHL